MSRSLAPVLTSLLLLLLLPPLLLLETTIVGADSQTSCSLKSCAMLDVELLQDYVTSLNLTELNATDLDTAEELLPFGALPSDWSRLILLQNRQPKGTPLHDNLLKLSRLILVAYFDSEERDDWTDDGQNISIVTLGNFNVIREVYNKEEQVNGGKFPVNENDPATTSYYDFLGFAISTTNFDQTFPDSGEDNETSQNKSNKTLSVGNNEDQSFQLTTRTSGNSFIRSSSQLNELEEDKSYSSSSVVTESSFVSSSSSNEQSSENSSENEAIHERSKENFVISHLQIKDNKGENGNLDEASSESFNIFTSDENIGNHREINAGDHNINITNLLVVFDSDLKIKDSREQLLTQSIEDFFAAGDEINRTVFSNFVNSTDLVANNVEAGRFASSESWNNDELLTKSNEDFFALTEESNDTTERNPEIYSGSEENIYKTTNETNNFTTISTNIMSNIFLRDSIERNEIVNNTSTFSDSNKVSMKSTEESNNPSNWLSLDKDHTENSTFMELSTTELFVTTDSSILASDPSFENFGESMLTEDEALIQLNNSLDFDKFIFSMSNAKLPFNADNIDESNSMKKNETNTTMLVQLISKCLFSENISATTAIYSNEITSMLDSTSLSPNKIENGSTKYLNILPVISPNFFENTTDQYKADGKAPALVSKFDKSSQNQTANLTDDLFRETIMKQLPADNLSSTTTAVSTERISLNEERNTPFHLLRNILMTYQQNSSNSTPIPARLRKVEAELPEEYGDQDEEEDDTGTWELIDRTFNLSDESSRNRPYKRSNRIAVGTKMNKRKSRKRAGVELDARRQYRSLFGLEPRQRFGGSSKYQGLDL